MGLVLLVRWPIDPSALVRLESRFPSLHRKRDKNSRMWYRAYAHVRSLHFIVRCGTNPLSFIVSCLVWIPRTQITDPCPAQSLPTLWVFVSCTQTSTPPPIKNGYAQQSSCFTIGTIFLSTYTKIIQEHLFATYATWSTFLRSGISIPARPQSPSRRALELKLALSLKLQVSAKTQFRTRILLNIPKLNVATITSPLLSNCCFWPSFLKGIKSSLYPEISHFRSPIFFKSPNNTLFRRSHEPPFAGGPQLRW